MQSTLVDLYEAQLNSTGHERRPRNRHQALLIAGEIGGFGVILAGFIVGQLL
jgi:hypothetical protein